MMVSRTCTALFLAISSTAVAAEPIQSVWNYDADTGDLSITLVDGVFADGAPTFEAFVDNTGSRSDEITPDFKNMGQAGGSTVVELSNEQKTATVKSGWISNFKLDEGENAIFVKLYNAANSRQNLLVLTNDQGLEVVDVGSAAGATILTGSVSAEGGEPSSETDASETDASESDSDSNAVEDGSEASESDSDSNAVLDFEASESDRYGYGSETDGSESDSDSNAVSAEDFIKAAMQAAGAAAGTECATAHCALESAACAEDADCSKPLYAGDFAALARLETNSAAAAAFTCLTGNDYTDCLNGKLEEAGGVAQATYTAAAVAAGTTCAGTICLDAAGACVAEQGCATILNTGVYRNLATVETAAGRAALACFTSYYYLTCFETTTAKNLGLEEEEEEEDCCQDEEGSESESEEADPCNSEEASECAEYCLSCGQACTKDDGSLDLGSESCLAGTVPLGTWGCTEGKCGCLTSCLKCAAYQDCLPTLADDQSTALKAALTKMGLSESESTAILAAVTTYATVPSVGWTELYTKHAGNLEGLFADKDLVKGLAETANLDASIQSSLAEAVTEAGDVDSGSAGLFSGTFAVAAMAFALL